MPDVSIHYEMVEIWNLKMIPVANAVSYSELTRVRKQDVDVRRCTPFDASLRVQPHTTLFTPCDISGMSIII